MLSCLVATLAVTGGLAATPVTPLIAPQVPDIPDWDYELFGEDWHVNSPLCGIGAMTESQSPIDILANEEPEHEQEPEHQGELPVGLPPLVIRHPAKEVGRISVANYAGRAIKIGRRFDMTGTLNANISGGPMQDRMYSLTNIHIHWGADEHGSEHTVNGVPAAMEMHFVHYNDALGNLSNAADKPNGLAVLGVMFDIGEPNAELQKIVNHIHELVEPNGEIKFFNETLKLQGFLPAEAAHAYASYQGSLTVPPCFETVTWMIARNRLTVSREQLAALRSVRMNANSTLYNNHRPVQPLNGRQIRFSSGWQAGVSQTWQAVGIGVLVVSACCLAAGVLWMLVSQYKQRQMDTTGLNLQLDLEDEQEAPAHVLQTGQYQTI